jgi:hypothetical protein
VISLTRKERFMAKENARAVVVTTEHRGVFFGYVKADGNLPAEITLTHARNAVFWSQSVQGVVGLAAKGPKSDCRIGPAIPEMTIWKITAVMACTPEAVAAWEEQPWK